jgi:hypothetical protein
MMMRRATSDERRGSAANAFGADEATVQVDLDADSGHDRESTG